MTEYYLGTALMIISLLVVFIAFPSQVYKNWKNKNFGISLILVVLGISVYLLRIPYTLIRKDYFILIPDLFGLFINLVLIAQYFHYRKNSKS